MVHGSEHDLRGQAEMTTRLVCWFPLCPRRARRCSLCGEPLCKRHVMLHRYQGISGKMYNCPRGRVMKRSHSP